MQVFVLMRDVVPRAVESTSTNLRIVLIIVDLEIPTTRLHFTKKKGLTLQKKGLTQKKGINPPKKGLTPKNVFYRLLRLAFCD